MGLKLNLGSGQNPQPGYLNVDKYGNPDFKCDLETFPWPWQDNSVSEILLNHALEHLGAATDVFIGIMKEMFRVCEAGAKIRIVVPHPRHDHFIGDPTHVRVVTPDMLNLFSKRANLRWREMHAANSPLALYHNVDFEVVEATFSLDEPYASEFQAGKISQEELGVLLKKHNNVATEIQMTLTVIKE